MTPSEAFISEQFGTTQQIEHWILSCSANRFQKNQALVQQKLSRPDDPSEQVKQW